MESAAEEQFATLRGILSSPPSFTRLWELSDLLTQWHGEPALAYEYARQHLSSLESRAQTHQTSQIQGFEQLGKACAFFDEVRIFGKLREGKKRYSCEESNFYVREHKTGTPKHLQSCAYHTNDPQLRSQVQGLLDEATQLTHPQLYHIEQVQISETHWSVRRAPVEGPRLSQVKSELAQLPIQARAPLALALMLQLLDFAIDIQTQQDEPLSPFLKHTISPQNTALTASGQVKVVDVLPVFPLRHPPAGLLTSFHPANMAPEQIFQSHRVEQRTIVFLISTMLFELLTGQDPFQGKNDLDTIQRLRSNQATHARKYIPDFPQPLGEVLEQGLASELTDRHKSPQELRSELLGLWGHMTDDTPKSTLAAFFAEHFQHNEILTRYACLQPSPHIKQGLFYYWRPYYQRGDKRQAETFSRPPPRMNLLPEQGGGEDIFAPRTLISRFWRYIRRH